MDIDILIATAQRPEMLAETLASIRDTDGPAGGRRVIVVDNADDDRTQRVCGEVDGELPVRCVVETSAGKSSALNRGLELVEAPLVAFTDDDVIVGDNWIDALVSGAERWPDHQVFGGRVLPRWPGAPPPWVAGTKYRGIAFSLLDPELERGPQAGFRPFGPNFAVRSHVFDAGVRFDPDLGPSSGDYIMGNETDLVDRVVAGGPAAVFVPQSRVRHVIREEQLSLTWLVQRARRYGRSMVVWDRRREDDLDGAGGNGPEGRLRWLVTGILQHGLKAVGKAIRGRRTEALDAALDAAVELGRLEAWR